MTKVAFQGIPGAYSEEAIHQFFGDDVNSLPNRTLEGLFESVEQDNADYAMLPIENAVAGSVNQAYELLIEHDLHIWAEVVLRVRHMLLAAPGTSLSDLRCICSHPQALAQCQRYLSRHHLELDPAFDTAGGARELSLNPQPGLGAIASALAAQLYGLEIVDQDIEDFPFNYTRFFVLSREDPPRAQSSKTSIVFTTPHRPGALFGCLGEFAMRGINLTKLESRPRLNKPWQYVFYLDFEGHSQDPQCESALMGLLRRSSYIKLLGSYPAAVTPIPDENQADPNGDSVQEIRK
jgi:prephenate dehydratase